MATQYEDQNHYYYDDFFQFQGRSQWMEKVWSEAFGENYPAGLHHYGYLTRHDLDVIAARLQSKPGDSLLDIACGKGGPGLWLAAALQLRLTGVDIVPSAVAQATAFQQHFDLQFPAQFYASHFNSLPVADQSMDAVICIDALWASHNKVVTLMEVKRVLKPGGKFIFTYWDLLDTESVPAFEQSGLRFIHREDTPDWMAYQQKVYAGITAHEAEIVAEMGLAANMLLFEAKSSPPYLHLSVRRIYEMQA